MGVNIYRDKHCSFFEIKRGYKSSLSFRKHCHEEYSLGLVELGGTNFWYDNKSARLSSNDMVFLPPGFMHSCNPVDMNNWKFQMLFIDKEWLDYSLEGNGMDLGSAILRYSTDDPALSSIGPMLKKLVSFASPLEKEELLLTIVHRIVRSGSSLRYFTSEFQRAGVEGIQQYLLKFFNKKVSLADLEQASGLNRFAIIQSFKDVFKLPPHAYQTLLRVNYAKKELKQGRPLLEVGLEAGFYDQSHFTKVFKNYVGLTPSAYQVPIA